jgi:hypothetical protein
LSRSPTLGCWSRGRRPMRLGGALQRGARAIVPLGWIRESTLHRRPRADARHDGHVSGVSRDRPCEAPLVRFCSPSAFASHAASFVGPILPRIGRCRFGVRRAALLAPRVRPALPQPIRSPMRFCARRPRRDPGHVGVPGSPYSAASVGTGHASSRVRRRRRSATRGRIAWPGRGAPLHPGGAHGVRPFAVLLLPARLRGRCPPRRSPPAVSRRVCPDDFRRGINRASRRRSRSCHPRCFGRRSIEDVRRGFWAWVFLADNPCRRRACPLARASFGNGRDCLGLCLSQVCRSAMRRRSDGLDPVPDRRPPERVLQDARWRDGELYRFRFLSARGFAAATSPGRCFADSSRDAHPAGHNRPFSVLMRLTPSRSVDSFRVDPGPAPCLRFVHLP